MPFGVGEVINALGLNPNIADPITRGAINVAQRVSDAGGSLQDGINAARDWVASQSAPSIPSLPSGGGSSGSNSDGISTLPRGITDVLSGNIPRTTAPTTNTNTDLVIAEIKQKLGYGDSSARTLLDAANSGNANAIKLLASAGIEPFYTYVTGGDTGGGSSSGGSSGGGGGGGASWTPLDDAQLAGLNLKNRQIGALFDPNYADGALVPLPDGTARINGTEIIIDPREKGQYKPVANAPGYLVDPVTGNVIDTNGNIIARDQLNETIRSNRVSEQQNASRIANDIYGTDLQAELGRGRLALDTTLGVGGLNLQAATSENEQKLKNILETEGLNLQSFLGTGNLNIGATNAETNRINSLSQRSQAGGNLALGNQQLQDARVQSIIALMANPQDFVQREYASRALNAPPGYTGPAFRDDPRVSQAIDQLLAGNDISNVDSLLPTYVAPTYNPVVLPNPTLPRVTAPAPQPQAQRQTPAQVGAISTPTSDISGTPYTNTNVAPADQAASNNFRQAGVPDWALSPLGYAEGTPGTKARKFIAGDPQADGKVNPELVQIHNPGPATSTSVTPLRDMASKAMIPDQVLTGAEAREQNPDMENQQEDMSEGGMGGMQNGVGGGGLSKLLAGILIEIGNQWGANGGPAKYAYGTDAFPIGERIQQYSQDQNSPTNVRNTYAGAGNALSVLNDKLTANSAARTAYANQPATSNQQQTNVQTNTQTGTYPNIANQVNLPTNFGLFDANHPFNLQNFYNQMRERYMQRFGGMGNWYNNQPHILPAYAEGTKKPAKKGFVPFNPEFSGDPQNYIPNTNGQLLASILRNIPLFTPEQLFYMRNRLPMPEQMPVSGPTYESFKGIKKFAYGTDYGAIPGNANLNAQGGYAGPRDSQGNPLGSITTYSDSAIRNLPGVQYALGNMPVTAYNNLNTGHITGAFGTQLPDVGGLNYSQLLDIQQDPSSWGVLSSLYNSANRDLMGIFNRVRARAPIGNVTDRSLIRTG